MVPIELIAPSLRRDLSVKNVDQQRCPVCWSHKAGGLVLQQAG